jgi:predicted ester cyclase
VESKDLLYTYLQVKFGLLDSKMLDKLLAADYKEHQPSVVRGVDEVRDFASKLRNAFTNQRFNVLDKIQDENKIVFRYNWYGIHTGQFYDWKPTNKEICTHGIIIAKIIDGKIAETWEEWDFAGFVRQLESMHKK